MAEKKPLFQKSLALFNELKTMLPQTPQPLTKVSTEAAARQQLYRIDLLKAAQSLKAMQSAIAQAAQHVHESHALLEKWRYPVNRLNRLQKITRLLESLSDDVSAVVTEEFDVIKSKKDSPL